MYINKILMVCLGITMFSCANKTVPPTIVKEEQKPTIIMIDGSDPIPKDLLEHIVRRTTYFCKNKYTTTVKTVKILHRAKERSTQVSYTCRKKG